MKQKQGFPRPSVRYGGAYEKDPQIWGSSAEKCRFQDSFSLLVIFSEGVISFSIEALWFSVSTMLAR